MPSNNNDNNDDINYLFGGMLREARRLAGLSQQKLAERLGITRGYISHTENGLTRPTLPMCRRLLDAADCVFEISYRRKS
jgi:transcriptional regulator with XRE-family HTH domain